MGNKTDTTIDIVLSTNSANTQTFVTISATLKDQNGNPIAQQKMVYQYSSDGTTWNNITTVTTGSDGVAQSNYKSSQTGTLTIRALFDGDTTYYASASNEETLSLSGTSGSFNIPWIWVTLISTVAIVAVALSIAVAKLRNGNHTANKGK